jgi:hypothetical protein
MFLRMGRLDYGALPIGKLLTLVGLEPKLIRRFSLPTSWKQLHNLYRVGACSNREVAIVHKHHMIPIWCPLV